MSDWCFLYCCVGNIQRFKVVCCHANAWCQYEVKKRNMTLWLLQQPLMSCPSSRDSSPASCLCTMYKWKDPKRGGRDMTLKKTQDRDPNFFFFFFRNSWKFSDFFFSFRKKKTLYRHAFNTLGKNSSLPHIRLTIRWDTSHVGLYLMSQRCCLLSWLFFLFPVLPVSLHLSFHYAKMPQSQKNWKRKIFISSLQRKDDLLLFWPLNQ